MQNIEDVFITACFICLTVSSQMERKSGLDLVLHCELPKKFESPRSLLPDSSWIFPDRFQAADVVSLRDPCFLQQSSPPRLPPLPGGGSARVTNL